MTTAATTAMAKLNGTTYRPLTAGALKSADVLKMSHEAYADYKLAQKEAQGKAARNTAAYRQAVIAGRSWKADVASKLAELFPQVERKLKHGFFGELESHNTRAPIEQLRDHLKALDPSKADAVDELLPNTKLRSVWQVAGKR